MRTFFATTLVFLLMSSGAIAGFGSGSGYYPISGSNSVVAPVWVESEGLFNLVVSLDFLGRPEDTKLYKSDSYTQLIGHLSVKWRSIALDKILAVSTIETGGLADLKKEIESAVDKLVKDESAKLMGDQKVEVVYSLTHFMLLEPRN